MWAELGIALIGILAFVWWTNRKDVSLPGPYEWPFLANALEVWRNQYRLLDWLVDYTKKFNGKVWTAKIPFTPRFMFITDPKDVEHVLKDKFPIYVKGVDFHEKLKDLLGGESCVLVLQALVLL